MSDGVHGWWEPLAAIMVIVLPLLLAWWLVVRGVQRPDRKKRGPGDNAHGRHDAS
jgi:hypothetical protein